MTCEEAIAALQEAKNIFCATGSKGIILAKIKIKLKVLMCCDEDDGGATTTTTTTTSTTTTTTTSTSTSTTTVDESPGLRLTYTTGNLPANDLAAWNSLFDLPTNGTAFTSLSTSGDEVTLIGGSGITLKQSLFRTSSTLLKIEDDVDCVVAISGGKNAGALSLCEALTTVTLNGAITAGVEALYTNLSLTSISMDALTTAAAWCFRGCTSATTFTLPSLTTASARCFQGCTSVITFTLPSLLTAYEYCFKDCTSATTFTLPTLATAAGYCFEGCTSATTIDMPMCTVLGVTPADADVFLSIIGQTITLNIAAVNATNNAGGVHASVAYLIANNTATVNYI